jgi:hypothetical protein
MLDWSFTAWLVNGTLICWLNGMSFTCSLGVECMEISEVRRSSARVSYSELQDTISTVAVMVNRTAKNSGM